LSKVDFTGGRVVKTSSAMTEDLAVGQNGVLTIIDDAVCTYELAVVIWSP
jgi:hypothetical protein